MIRFDGVTKQYPDGTVAVDDLSLTAPAGRITVLVGPSGCGKTTSLRMVNRMIEPTRGTITLDGQDTARMRPSELRRGIGYVIQHAGLFPHRTVLDNIGTVPCLLGWDRRRTRQRSGELLERVGLAPELGDRYPSQLSGGQQQRVGVARALAADPPVMLMDEPFSAVDPVVREQLQVEFLRLQGELGKTILFVTHDIDEAIKLGDQVAVLRVGGRLAQVADPAYLLAHPGDDFVADFVGRDRGYRALQFQSAPPMPLKPERTLLIGEPTTGYAGSWALVVDRANRPLGWVEPARIDGPVTDAHLHRGGTLARASDSLRAALDAALSAPSRRGVIVDDSGALCGTVLAREVLALIEETDRPVRAEPGATTGDDKATGSGTAGGAG
ncbi:MAG TPA: ATP-binding cassette domain-containing protein [Dermatophilaceae bacterium]|nr:ATP-binding cassette domain-containing protein [Dermatophilaceae bacterium]